MTRESGRHAWRAGQAAALGLLGGLLVFVPAKSAEASDAPGGELLVTRSAEAEDCPDDHALLAATLALGTAAPQSSAEPLRIDVSFARGPSGYTATIRSSGRKQGVRELVRTDPTCAPLGDATALVVAVLLDLVPLEKSTAAPSPVEPPPPAAAIASRPAHSPSGPSSGMTPFSIGVGIDGGVAYGLLGSIVTGSVAVAARPRWGRFELGAGALFVPERSFPHGVGSVDVFLVTSRLEACAWLTPPQDFLSAGACGGLMVGELHGQGRDFYDPEPASDLWIAAEAAGVARLALGGPWALRLAVSLVVPFREQTFSLRDTGVAFETSPAAVLAELGPEVRFP